MDAKTMRTMSCKMIPVAGLVAAPWMVAYGEALEAENGGGGANASVQPLESSQSAEASGTASAAHDEPARSTLFHLHWLGGNSCLESSSAGQVYLNPCRSYNNFQRWSELYFPPWSGAATIQIHLQNSATGRCLDSVGGQVYSVGAQVYTRPCQTYDNSQTWETRAAGNNVPVTFKNLATGLCLQILQGRVVLGSCHPPEHAVFWVKEP
jgi:Ricin-type beta-trefoil lectin domain